MLIDGCFFFSGVFRFGFLQRMGRFRAFDLLEALSAEKNHIVETWKKVGLKAQTAGDSQALIQLKRAYCDRKECLRCRFGYEYLKKTDHDKNR